MEASSSTSKVTVTYWDPAALFPLITPDLQARLPLRNLHWKSPNRPLRSISSLHVDLVPYTPPPPTIVTSSSPPPGSSTSNSDLTRVRSSDSTRSTGISANPPARPRGGTNRPRKERRHQIPGLRNTPYLKVYVLRCDDNESYKNTQRKLLREWISTHATAEGVDNHDAFEWLIIHVVLPGTQAATQPRTSSGASPSGGARLFKAGSTTLLDKIRSDFNNSSSKVDRVIQMRVPPTHPALSTLSPPVSTANASLAPAETPAETEMAWVDLVSKFKAQILASFDARVSQYEEDIREKDSQRRLPGWNFCTFFVLKEGLAIAFESVGLVEDALVLYDELGYGLEAIVQDQQKEGDITGGSFHAWTKECLWWVEEARERLSSLGDKDSAVDISSPVDAEKKPYRELILSNEISVLDFRCYLFARQTTLLVRLGRRSGEASTASEPHDASQPQEIPTTPGGTKLHDDVHRLAEVCRRGIEFITSTCVILRADLWTGYSGNPEGKEKATEKQEVISAIIENLVCSWTYGVAQQLLGQTASNALPINSNDSSQQGLLPRRTSSLANDSGTHSPPRTTKAQGSGMEDLAAGRAELILLARNVLENFGKKKGWINSKGWFHAETTMEEIDLDANDDQKRTEWVSVGIRNKALRDAVVEDDQKVFYQLFGELSEMAMKHYEVAKRFKGAERVEADLAALKFHLKDYEQAASHLDRMTMFYGSQGWGVIETALLDMHSKCLKELYRPEEYARVLLKLLFKSAAAEKAKQERRAGKSTETHEDSLSYADMQPSVEGYVSEALNLSEHLQTEIVTPMTHFWSDISVGPYPQALVDRDGFQLTVKMRYLLQEEMEVDRIVVRLISSTSTGKDIWLESLSRLIMKKGIVRTTVQTSMNIPGTYVVDRLAVHARKLSFIHELSVKRGPSGPGVVESPSLRATRFEYHPAPRSLAVRLATPRKTYLDRMRMLDIILDVGENDLATGELRMRSATAGLRLMTGSLEAVEGDSVVVDESKPGFIALKRMQRCSKTVLRVPYSAETELTDLSLRVEVDYTTALGNFHYAEALDIQVALPLAVNVQDVFKMNALFSKFQISTAAAEIPLRIMGATLMPNRSFSTAGGIESSVNEVVFAKQPASFVYKITRRPCPAGETAAEPEPLELVIEYTSIDEEIRDEVVSAFTASITSAGFHIYVNYLLPVLLAQLRLQSSTALETVALLEEVEVGHYAAQAWEEALGSITPAKGERDRVQVWLKEFYRTNQVIPVNRGNSHKIARAIVIPVEVPQLQVIHTVSLNLLPYRVKDSPSMSYAPRMATVGQPLAAELVIKHSRQWDATIPPDAVPVEFYYELQYNVESWLISGRKRAHFSATDSSTHVFSLLLVPVKSGHLLLPSVDIKQAAGPEMSLETDYTGNSATLLVLPDVRSTTVRIDSVYGSEPVVSRG